MKTYYDHETHSYKYKPTGHAMVERLSNMRGVHNDKIGNAQPSGLFVWVLLAFVALAILCKEPVAEVQHSSTGDIVCVLGYCL